MSCPNTRTSWNQVTDMPPDDQRPATPQTPSMEALFVRYRGPLLGFFGNRVGFEVAEEYVQDAFLRFSQAGYDMSAKDAGALLFAIAANLFRDHLRRLRRNRTLGFNDPDALDSAADIASDNPLPDRQLEGRQTLAQVMAAMGRLPPRCAAVFLMHRLQGKSQKAIAQELGISISMVEKHIRRAIEGLIAALDDGAGGAP